jgi:hypothetical protein
MGAYLPRIVGTFLLVCSLLLIVFSPPAPQFSIPHFFLFLACFVCGVLLVIGILGTHPIVARLRHQASEIGALRKCPLSVITEQVFPFAASPLRRRLVTALCAAIGLSMISLGFLLLRFLPGSSGDRILAGTPPWIGGILCLWISIRYPNMYIQIMPLGEVLPKIWTGI